MAEAAGLSDDAFLGGALRLLQPERGYRAGSDSVLLAAAVKAEAGQRVLDAGAGVGAVALALAHRLPEVRVDALELQPALAALCARNARRNGLGDRVAAFAGDLAAPPAALLARPYDHVVSNPPYHDAGANRGSPLAARDLARRDSRLALGDWIRACLARLGPGGSLTLIHPAGRRDEVLAALAPAAGDVVQLPLLAARNRPAKRLLTRAVKGGTATPREAPGLLLHRCDGGYTEAAEAVLRHGKVLDFDQAMLEGGGGAGYVGGRWISGSSCPG